MVEKIVKFFEKQTFGHLILIGSVAGDREERIISMVLQKQALNFI